MAIHKDARHETPPNRPQDDLPSDAEIADVADVFALLADPARLKLLIVLRQQELCVRDLAAICHQGESAVSHHLRLLRAHRAVRVRREGRMAYYSLGDAHIRLALDVALLHNHHAPPAAHPERRSEP
ncbi:metalloregulator ArsR/SmtB family transcription factor [Streptomyces sp. NPDC046805]|uniref:ArsR/SmtB family transcription factor n=1 Tax=Streptomyces sp. NPDC046805 TaxID=3155134 RepID=UPI0033D8FAAA